MEIENSVLSTRLSGNQQIPIVEQRLTTVVLKSSDFDLVENKSVDKFTIFSIRKSNVGTMFITLFSCVWFLLHQIYPVLHVLLSAQSYINHKRTEVFCCKRFKGGSRAAATSKMDITKHSILDVAAALDPPLRFQCSLQQQKFKSAFLKLVIMDTEEPSRMKLNKDQSDNIDLSHWHL